MLTYKNIKSIFLTLIVCALLAGCASEPRYSQAAMQKRTATGVAIKPSETGRAMTPSVEYIRVKMERSIFLDPPEGNANTYVRVRDTSGRNWGIELEKVVAQELNRRGFRAVKDATNAAYAINVNVLFVDEASAAEIAQLDETEYGQSLSGLVGSTLVGAVAGGVGGGMIDDGGLGGVAVGTVVGAAAGGLANTLYSDSRDELIKAQQETKFFSVVADIEVRERIKSGIIKRTHKTARQTKKKAGSSGDLVDNRDSGGQTVTQASTEVAEGETSNWKRHQTRMTGKAKGKLVVFEDVQGDFAMKMARSLAGLI